MNTLTVTPVDQNKTNETDETNVVSNQEFMEAIFSCLPADVRPVLVGFSGNPATVNKGHWSGYSWLGENAVWIEEDNNYFSLAAFKPDEEGKYARKKIQFNGLYCLMLDDIGSEVDSGKLAVPPSWLLETSTDNYQAGYILEEPITDAQLADKLMKAIIAAELCDPGAGGPTARLARLPVAVNGKYAPIFKCQLRDWHPDLRYSVEALVTGLGLDMSETKKSMQANSVKATAKNASGNVVWQPRPTTNPVIDALLQGGLYKCQLGERKHDITCPWVGEHTGGIDGGTAYFEPSDD